MIIKIDLTPEQVLQIRKLLDQADGMPSWLLPDDTRAFLKEVREKLKEAFVNG